MNLNLSIISSSHRLLFPLMTPSIIAPEISSSQYATRRKELLSLVKQLRSIGYGGLIFQCCHLLIVCIGLKLTLICPGLPLLGIRVLVCKHSIWHIYQEGSLITPLREVKRGRGHFWGTELFGSGFDFQNLMYLISDNCPSRCGHMYPLPNGMPTVVHVGAMVVSSLHPMGVR